MWVHVTVACLTPLRALKPSLWYIFCKASYFGTPPPSVIHCHVVASIQLWLSYLCWFMRCLCKKWDCIQPYQGTHIKSTWLRFLQHLWLKENWKQKCARKCFWVKDQRSWSRLSFPSLALTSMKSESAQISSLSWSNGKGVKTIWLVTVTQCGEEDFKGWRETERRQQSNQMT